MRKIGMLFGVFKKEITYKKGILFMALLTMAACAFVLLFMAEVSLPSPITDILPEYRRTIHVQFNTSQNGSTLYDILRPKIESGEIRSVYFVGFSANDPYIEVVGVKEAFVPNEFFSSEFDTLLNNTFYFYADKALIPSFYSFKLSTLQFEINGNMAVCKGVTPFTRMHNFMNPHLKAVDAHNSIKIGNQALKIVAEKDYYSSHVNIQDENDQKIEPLSYRVYLPLEDFGRLGLFASYMSIVYETEIDSGRIADFDSTFSSFQYTRVYDEDMENKEKILTQMDEETLLGTPMLVIIMCICSINQLVFLGNLIQSFSKTMKKLYIIGVSYLRQGVMVFFVIMLISLLAFAMGFAVYGLVRFMLIQMDIFSFYSFASFWPSAIGYLLIISASTLFSLFRLVRRLKKDKERIA